MCYSPPHPGSLEAVEVVEFSGRQSGIEVIVSVAFKEERFRQNNVVKDLEKLLEFIYFTVHPSANPPDMIIFHNRRLLVLTAPRNWSHEKQCHFQNIVDALFSPYSLRRVAPLREEFKVSL